MSAYFPASDRAAAPDFRHVEAWIFDLDNTLYPASSNLFAQIDMRMTLFVQNFLGASADEAHRLQKIYYRDHGTTLNGLMRLHGVDPDEYLGFVHDLDLSVLSNNPRLRAAIGHLPGRRYIFTNGCRNHASRVLQRLALADLFDEIWDIRTMGYRPKPDSGSYRRLLDERAIPSDRAAMFDDVARNLVPAHEMGMTTIWLRNGSPWSKQGPDHPVAEARHIHYEIEDLCEFLDTIRI